MAAVGSRNRDVGPISSEITEFAVLSQNYLTITEICLPPTQTFCCLFLDQREKALIIPRLADFPVTMCHWGSKVCLRAQGALVNRVRWETKQP